MMKPIRCLALILSVAMLTILLASSVFVVSHADHDCDREHHHCLICEQISLCTQHLKTISSAVAAPLMLAAALGIVLVTVPYFVPVRVRGTLVTCKVKLTI